QSSRSARVLRLLLLQTSRRTPSPTLFPYTTLFRSPRRGRAWGASSSPVTHADTRGSSRARRESIETMRAWAYGLRRNATCSVRGDRKSTRLNSSHVSISYAVFCLKKKNHRLPPLAVVGPVNADVLFENEGHR